MRLRFFTFPTICVVCSSFWNLASANVLYAADAIAVPASISIEGVPPIPASLAQELRRYQSIRSASFQDWDSEGTGMYILTRFGDTSQVHYVEKPGGARTQLTFSAERVLGVKARPKRDEFLYVADEGGAENYQFFLQKREGGEPRRITDGKSRHIAPVWSPSGSLLAYSSDTRNGRDMDLYISAPEVPGFTRILKEVQGQWTAADWSPDEKKLAVVEYISINESYIHLIDIPTGSIDTITPRNGDPKAETVAATDPKFSKDGAYLYWLSDRRSEFLGLNRLDLKTGESEIVDLRVKWDIEDYDVSDDGLIALVVNVDGSSKLHFIGLDDLDPRPRPPELPTGVVSGLRFRPGSHEVAFTLSSARRSADAVSINLDDARPGQDEDEELPLKIWTKSETGGLDAESFAKPELIRYASFDGRDIPAYVYRPSSRKFPGPRPVLIDIHGGPEGQSRPGFLGSNNYLIDHMGIVVIYPNVRGSTGYGKGYAKLDNGVLREGAVKDIGALFDWIEKQSDLDKTKVAVTGGSYGGFMSLAVQTTYNDRIRVGIDVVGISNFVSFLKNTKGYRRDLRRAEYGDERVTEIRAFLEKISPLSHADKIHTPILVVQGKNDPRVPISEAEQIVSAVKKNGVPIWYMIGNNEGHGFAKKANQDYLLATRVLFLRRYLIDRTD